MSADTTARSTREIPDTYLIIGGIAVLVYLMSFLLPPGQFSMVEVIRDGTAVDVVDPESYRSSAAAGLSLFSTEESPGLFNAVFEGLTSGSRTGGAVGIMAFILLTGGAFGVVMATGAFSRAVNTIVAGGIGSGAGLLAALFVAFSLGGAVFGMGEEAIPFVLMLMPLLGRLGYDGVTVVLVTYVATQIGFATSWMNPFSVAIAQGIAQIPILSGLPLRVGMWFVFTTVGVVFTLRYAGRSRLTTAEGDAQPAAPEARLSSGDWLILAALAATIAWIIGGVVFGGYYLPEIATQFVILGVAAGVIGTFFALDNMSANSAVAAFRQGAKDLLPAALVVGFARGIVYLMGGDDPTSPSMLNTLLHFASASLAGLPEVLAAWCMYLAQSVFNFFVTSGSGQAALTMPLMAPLADLLGVSRQVAVLAFQLGDGLTNLLVPTSAALMGCLGAAKLEWTAWVRVLLPLFLLLFGLASTFVIAAVMTGYS